ncbi:hypothetical protein [Streptomyces bacillaris]|uniref:hypothetical protein n=1 Tax=Streptomyces bacillaris TaxID=68179 RepID=UPI003460531D
MPVTVTDTHTGWTCRTGASLIADAMTPGPGRLGTLHGCIYVCPAHQADAEERITAAGYGPRVEAAPPAHRWDPWPCGHITAYSAEAATGMSAPVTQPDTVDTAADTARPSLSAPTQEYGAPYFPITSGRTPR